MQIGTSLRCFAFYTIYIWRFIAEIVGLVSGSKGLGVAELVDRLSLQVTVCHIG